MSTDLNDAGVQLFEELTYNPLLVVDTEFCSHEDEHHLISIAIVPVIGGRRTRAGQELYLEMNPGVPIDPATSSIHGFTDDDVADLPRFASHARRILRRLAEDGAVFVCHNTIDAHVLKRALNRLHDEAAERPGQPPGQDPSCSTNGNADDSADQLGEGLGLADLPDLPILDTQRLAIAVGYPGVTKTSPPSLNKLCELTGIARTEPAHNARADAATTADVLIALLRHAANTAAFWTFDELLDAADGGTLHDPAGPSYIRFRTHRATPIPPEHIAKHIHPLSDPVAADSDEAERWLELAVECATLRCPYLRDEALVAAPANAHVLLKPLMDDLPHLHEPGQAATLLVAIYELLNQPAAPGQPAALEPASVLKWWAQARETFAATPACERDKPNLACPACQDGHPCPRDIMLLPIAERALLGSETELNAVRVEAFFDVGQRRPLSAWRRHHSDILGYCLWRVARHLFDLEQDQKATDAIDRGIALGLHTLEPRFARLACERLLEIGQTDEALAAAGELLGTRTSDLAYDDLADWLTFTEHALHVQEPPPKVITHPRRARPAGLTNPRLYS